MKKSLISFNYLEVAFSPQDQINDDIIGQIGAYNLGDYIGKNATFTYFERTKAGSYRHPLFKAIRDYE